MSFHPRSHRHRLVGAAATLALVAAACGGDDGATTTVAPSEAPATAAPATEAPTPAGPMGGPFGPACDAVPADGPGSFDGMAADPAATAASNNPVLSTLVTAVVEAGLVDTLNGEGPFTIFAPTNDAFAAIPADQLAAVLADLDLLTTILTYHVVAGERLSSQDLVTMGSVTTVQGDELVIAETDGSLTINGTVTSVCMDVATANATVHIIDGVLLPAS